MLTIGMITVDCSDVQTMLRFWSAATGADVEADYGDFAMLATTPRLGFQKVPDPTPGKNKMHLDTSGGDRLAEVQRLVDLGAQERETHAMEGFSWTVLADPEGNLFCVGDAHS